MHVLYDMQDAFEDIISLSDVNYITPVGETFPTLKLEQSEDVKSIRVSSRESEDDGVSINIAAIPDIRAGDRITITGRIGIDAPFGSWGIALSSDVGAKETSQLAQMLVPRTMYSLSYKLSADDLKRCLLVQTTRWGAVNPTMDFLVDNILIFRGVKSHRELTDSRSMVYSLERDSDIQQMREGSYLALDDTSGTIRHSGKPAISIVKREGSNILHVGHRSNDWDGIDIDLPPLKLLTGNTYQIKVIGRVDGQVPKDEPKGVNLMIQGMPNFSWRSLTPICDNQEFELCHTLTQSEIESWTAIRITSNNEASAVSFYIYSIDIKRLG